MITAIHIEDEPRNIDLLQNLLQTYCSDKIELVGSAKNIKDAYALIKSVNPQLVYLDIELNNGNAFELLDGLLPIPFQVIFITAYNEYAVKAFRINAIDYLLKPISIRDLVEATDKAIEKIKDKDKNMQLNSVIKDMNVSLRFNKISIPVNDGVIFVPFNEIIKCEAKGSYTVISLNSKKIITASKTLREIEKVLPTNYFIRVHNNTIINILFLKKYYRGKQSYVELEDGTTVILSLRKKVDFLSLLKDFE
jgi:two-component system, LytTR family, response regulator